MPTFPHYRITLEGVYGTAANPLEIWRTGVNVQAGSGPSAPGVILPARAQAIYDGFVTAYMGNVRSSCVLTACDIRFIGALGRQPTEPDGSFTSTARHEANTPGSMSGGVQYPFQIAYVASLLTARSGPEGKGRMFLPTPGFALENDGRLPAALGGQVAEPLVNWIRLINTQFAADGADPRRVSVISSKNLSSPVTGMRVGRVLDTQRRRRGDLLEGYSPTVAV